MDITNLLIGFAATGATAVLTFAVRWAIRNGYLGFKNQLSSLIKDKQLQKEVFLVIDSVERFIGSDSAERIVRETVDSLKKSIPGKFDDAVLTAIVEALYQKKTTTK